MGLLFLSFLSVALACRCLGPPSVYSSSRSTPDAIIVTPMSAQTQCDSAHCYILATVNAVYQGCAVVGQTINITTSSSRFVCFLFCPPFFFCSLTRSTPMTPSASCGMKLPNTSDPFLFFGSYINTTKTLKVYSWCEISFFIFFPIFLTI